MPKGEIKFMRIPISDVKCEDCGKDLPFATWAHYQPDSKKAVCVDEEDATQAAAEQEEEAKPLEVPSE